MTNETIARMLRNMAAALIIKDANHFRIIAYEKVADSIEHLTSELKDIWDEGKLEEVPGIGPTIAGYIDELFRTGKIRHFDNTFKKLSPALFELLLIPGIGPKRAHQLTQAFHINTPKSAITNLEKVARSGKIAELPGWGEKSQTEILEGIATFKRGQIKEKRMALPYADTLAQEVMGYLGKMKEVNRVDMLGSLRRKVATIGDIDLAVATDDAERVIEAFVKYPKVRKVVDRGPQGATVLLSIGRQVDLRVQKPHAYGAMLQYFTGSKHHNIRLREYALKQGLSLSEHGIKQISKTNGFKLKKQNYNKKQKLYEYATEAEFYAALGLPWIPPEIREDTGEIEAASSRNQSKQPGLPKLVEPSDMKGDLHIHSNYDLKPSHDLGQSSLQEILTQATHLGYEYIGISDHNPSTSTNSRNEIQAVMKRRKEYFEQIYSSWSKRVKKRVQLFIMMEVDVAPDGKIAILDEAAEYLDTFIVSIHSSFNLPREKMTERILSGLSHQKAKILGHPTGRLLGVREGYEADWEKIFGFCLENRKALEINSWPERLDLPDRLVREAVARGVKLVINTDSHAVSQMQLLHYGVDVARRGWAQKQDILNTMSYNDLHKWLKS